MFDRDDRPLRAAWAIALAVHFLAFTAVVPMGERELAAAPEEQYTVIRKWVPPPPPVETKRTPVKRRSNPVPIPDPTPDEPEMLVTEEYVYEVEAREETTPEFTFALPAGPPVAPPDVVRVGAEVRRPELLHRVLPDYPDLARRARLECYVVMEARIDRQGNVVDAAVLKPCGLGLNEAALDAVLQWKYAPTTVDGRPVEVLLTVTMKFRLD